MASWVCFGLRGDRQVVLIQSAVAGVRSCVRDAAATMAGEYTQPQAVVERDMCKLCEGLLARGLIELDGDSSH